MLEVEKKVRRNTGQLLSNITDRSVLVIHSDETEDRFISEDVEKTLGDTWAKA